jgi:hypothetical protein
MIRSLPLVLCIVAHASAGVITLPDPHSLPPEGETAVWSPLFQATWDAMNKEIGGKPKKIDPPNELMSRLDAFDWKADTVMPEGAWKTWAGEATPDFLKRVNAEAKEMTGEEPFKLSGEQIPGTIACFGLLDREVEFEKPFFRSARAPLEFGAEKSPVRFFGTDGDNAENFGESVEVLSYRPVDGSLALEVSCKGSDEKVILYRPAKAQDFATACRWIREWRKNPGQSAGLPGNWNDRWLHKGDEVRLPYVSLDASADFAGALQGGRFYGKPGDPWAIRIAKQKTKFELHEKGAKVRMETSIEADPFAAEPRKVPRRFIYDRPFFVFLWSEKAEWPYLGVWVGDDSALRKF